MKTKIYLLLIFIYCLSSNISAQIAYQGFEQNAADTWGITLSTPACTNGGDVWDYSTTLGSFAPNVGSQFWGVQDLDGNCGSSAGETITFATTSVAGFTGVTIQFDYNIFEYDNGDDVFYTVILDGVAQPQVQLVNGNSNFSTGGYITETIAIPNGTSTVGLELLIDQNGGGDYAAFDNFILDGVGGSCPHTITGFSPLSGPAGTEVTITGSGFTGATTVNFNGTPATVTFVDANTLIAEVPSGATTGLINVIEAACIQITGATFTYLEQTGSCGSTFSDLVISEVFDNASGSLGYIEIYNGTGATIDLANYRIDRFATIGSVTSSHAYNFPTFNIADGQVVVAKVSADADIIGVTPDFQFATSTSGFNADDRLELVHISTATLIDDFHDDQVGANGFVYRRNTNISGPNPTYNAAEWTTGTTGDVSDLGIYNIAAGGTPTISTQPADQLSCDLSLSVAATAAAGTLTYQWFFNENDGVATGWTAVSGAAFPNATVAGETTSNLIITGDMEDYDGYQFYCQVTEDASCNIISEAVQYTLDVERFFRSTGTGNWNDVNTWEMATSAAGPWSPTCVIPDFDNSDYIHILSGHTVTLDIDLTVDELVIETGGTLEIPTTSQLTFNDGIGTDMQVEGTLIDNGTAGNGLSFNTGATWLLDANGTVIKTRNSSVVQYENNYEGGIATIPATATWIYRYTGTGTVAVNTLGMFYPNLYFESTDAAGHAFNGGPETFNGASGFATVKGSLFIGNTGVGAVEIFNINTNATPMQILGDLVLGGNGAVATSRIENNNGITIGTGLEVFGDVVINVNGQLDFDDALNATADGSFSLHGNWTDNNTGDGFVEGESTVAFVGTALQTVTRTTDDENFYNVIVNKASGDLQISSNNIVIENDMTFINGIVQTATAALVVFQPDATSTGQTNASHCNGPVIKETSNSTSTNFTFPTGKNGLLGQIGIQTVNTFPGERFRAEYYDAGYGTYNRNTAELDHVSVIEWWNLEELDFTTSEAEVTLHWGPHSDVVSMTSLRVAHYYTEAPSVIDQWESEGNAGTTGTVTAGTITSNVVTSFSPFTLADIVDNQSLPLELVNFEVNKVNTTAVLDWQVANDFEGDEHCVERSANGTEFTSLNCLKAPEDQPTAFYNYIDEQPMTGDNYYRIRHTDNQGMVSYSPVRVLNFAANEIGIAVYPNPAKDLVQIRLNEVLDGEVQVQLIDALGRVVIEQSYAGFGYQQALDVSQLAAGSYVLRLLGNEATLHVEKITIQ